MKEMKKAVINPNTNIFLERNVLTELSIEGQNADKL